MTKVNFRKYPNGEIIALFSDIPGGKEEYMCTSYMHIGQHSDADYTYVMSRTYPATEEEYKSLLNELVKMYDDLEIYDNNLKIFKKYTNVTLTFGKAKEWYKKGGELREIALQAFNETELMA